MRAHYALRNGAKNTISSAFLCGFIALAVSAIRSDARGSCIYVFVVALQRRRGDERLCGAIYRTRVSSTSNTRIEWGGMPGRSRPP